MGTVSRKITLSAARRIICISDIHGELELLQRLLEKVSYDPDDQLILLGDLFAKGPKPLETLRYIIRMAENPDVYVLRGNCDLVKEGFSAKEAAWLDRLPHILETDDFIFVHGGLPSMDFDSFAPIDCMKYDNFMERAGRFDKWVVTGHWPVNNYCHRIICSDPIVNAEKHIIAIDGGCVVNRRGGQLNALLIENGAFSFAAVNAYPPYRVTHTQEASGGTLSVTFQDRFIEVLKPGEVFSLCRHLASGRELELPNDSFWYDAAGQLCAIAATDYYLPVEAGETVSLIRDYGSRVFAKKNGVNGWIAVP